MKVAPANFLALLLLCACTGVLYFWSRLERRLERHKRGFHERPAHPAYSAPGSDLSAKTFRALLAVPVAQKLHLSSRIRGHNVTETRRAPVGREDGNQLSLSRSEVLPDSPEPVEDGIFWSRTLEEDDVSEAFGEERARAWRWRARGSQVVSLDPGCGRTSNQLATFSDGTKACVRYGINAEQIQGETLSYYLAALLGITNLPPLALAQLDVDSEQWASVRRRMDSLQWSGRAVVSLTEWIPDLSGVVTPEPLRLQDGKGLYPSLEDLRNKTKAELLQLVQWSDLVVFDYLTANFDRLVSNLFSLQWDPRVMERETSNLLQTHRGTLVFIDNEAGLVHGYRVLDMWEKYHISVLRSVCMFRRRTAQRVMEMHRHRDVQTRLYQLYRDSEPLAADLGFLSDDHARMLQERIDRVYKHILHCKGKYGQL